MTGLDPQRISLALLRDRHEALKRDVIVQTSQAGSNFTATAP
jgi:hypothetical protein